VAIKEYTTNYQGASPVQDPSPVTNVQPNLLNDSYLGAGNGDAMRVSQLHALRDKLDAVARLLGDSVAMPIGSVADILARDATNGDALQLRLRKRVADPAAVANKVFVYAKDDGGVSKLYMRWSDGTITEVGTGGGGGGTTPHEEELISTGQTTLQLAAQPVVAGATLVGYDLQVFKNGVRLRHVASPVAQNEYHYNNSSPDRTCSFVADTGSVYTFVYRS
jgi:hypothetical protein